MREGTSNGKHTAKRGLTTSSKLRTISPNGRCRYLSIYNGLSERCRISTNYRGQRPMTLSLAYRVDVAAIRLLLSSRSHMLKDVGIWIVCLLPVVWFDCKCTGACKIHRLNSCCSLYHCGRFADIRIRI